MGLQGRSNVTRCRTFHLWFVVYLLICCIGVFTAPARADTLKLSFPLRCTLHKTCFIQNYVDTDRSPGRLDYRCGQATYDGHKGTDFRVASVAEAKQGVAVIAAAPGRVTSIRDGMVDRLIGKNAGSVRGKECGNGVVIDHGRGRKTQYCHLRRGSVAVRRGQQVSTGELIGLVGYSGRAQFPHLHLSVRYNGRVIDPFTGESSDAGCGKGAKNSLWQDEFRQALTYRRGEIIESGFTGELVNSRDLEEGRARSAQPTSVSPAMVFYVRFINLQKGDRVRAILYGPSGVLAEKMTKPLQRNRALQMVYAGRKLRAKRWPEGRYRGQVQLLRSGSVVVDNEVVLTIP